MPLEFMPVHMQSRLWFRCSHQMRKNMEIRYFSNFKAKLNLQKCTDSPEHSLIAKMRNNIEIRYFSIIAQSSLRQE